MTTSFTIPASRLMNNDSGDAIHVVSVQPPTNGEILKGSVVLNGDGTVTYTTAPYTIFEGNSDHFSYTIHDQFGQIATANVEVYLPLPEVPHEASFQGPNQITSLYAFSNGEDDLVAVMYPFTDPPSDSLIGPDIMFLGQIVQNTARNPSYPRVSAGWTLGPAHTVGHYTAYEVKRVFTHAEYFAQYHSNNQIAVLDGAGSSNGETPLNYLWADLIAYTCPGLSVVDMLQFFEITAYGPGQQTATFPSTGIGTVSDTAIHAFVDTDHNVGGTPITSSGDQFYGFGNDYECSAYLQNDVQTNSPNPLNGITFSGQAAAFSVFRSFVSSYS